MYKIKYPCSQNHTRWRGKKEPDFSETEIVLLRQTPRHHILLKIHPKTHTTTAISVISPALQHSSSFLRARHCVILSDGQPVPRPGVFMPLKQLQPPERLYRGTVRWQGQLGLGGCWVCKAAAVVPDSFGTGSSSLITTIFSSSSSSSSIGLISTLPRAGLAKKVMDVLKCHLADEVANEILPSVNPHSHLSCFSHSASEHQDTQEK